MKRQDIITGIDIGTSAIRIVVGQREADGGVRIVGVGEAPSQGMTKGNITDIEEVVSALSESLERAERMSGQAIERAVVGINGTHIRVIQSQGVVAVSRASGEVDISDTERAIEAAQALATPPNYEILHVLPLYYNLDNQKNIKDPVGMSGVRLEAQTQIIMGQSSQVKQLSKCVYRTGVDVDGFVFSILATASAVLDKKQKETGVVLLNIGSATTSMAVYEDGEVVLATVLPIGSDHITQDLAIGLRCHLNVAEAVKREVGAPDPEKISKRDEIDLSKFSSDIEPRTFVSSKHVAEIIQARLDELFELVDKELRAVDRSASLPAGVVITGGGALLQGVVEIARRVLRLPAFIGVPAVGGSHIEKIDDPRYAAALGLVLYAQSGSKRSTVMPNFSSVKMATERVTKWFKELLP